MPLTPLVLSPALPSELLTYILDHHVYPTTLIVCFPRTDFLDALARGIEHQPALAAGSSSQPLDDVPPEGLPPPQQTHAPNHQLLSSPLYQVAISRHVRTVFIPTVTHLRAYLSVFSPDASKIPAPPSDFIPVGRRPPHLLVYGAVELHRDTSEWSAQGLGSTAAALVETGHRLGWHVVLAEPPGQLDDSMMADEDEQRAGDADAFAQLLKENMPILSGSVRRLGLDGEQGGGWSGRTVEVGRVLSRWFRFQRGDWDDYRDDNFPK
ncbi:hypothetical protein JX266_001220 [Neoarthrinium moseri]|nr:hypothetical protein JX266_001220 [Neoarthrinium moseri]